MVRSNSWSLTSSAPQAQGAVDGVDEAVHAPELLFHSAHDGLGLRPVRHVGRQREDAVLAGLLPHLGRQRLDAEDAAAGDGDHARALDLGQTPRRAVADAAGRAGDDDQPPRQRPVLLLHMSVLRFVPNVLMVDSIGKFRVRLKGRMWYNNAHGTAVPAIPARAAGR